MSIPTVNQVALSVMKEFGEDTSNTDLVTQVEEWIQNVYDEIGIQSEWRYQWLMDSVVTIIGQRLYTFNGILDQQISAQFAVTNTPLVMKRKQQLMELGINLLLSGTSKNWYIENYDSSSEKYLIGLYPVPDSVQTINFLGQIQPQELTSNTKLPFPRRFLFVLKDGVRYRFKLDDKDYQGAQLFKSSFKENIATLKAIDNGEKAQKQRMYVQDIGFSSDPLVRFPPDHFRN